MEYEPPNYNCTIRLEKERCEKKKGERERRPLRRRLTRNRNNTREKKKRGRGGVNYKTGRLPHRREAQCSGGQGGAGSNGRSKCCRARRGRAGSSGGQRCAVGRSSDWALKYSRLQRLLARRSESKRCSLRVTRRSAWRSGCFIYARDRERDSLPARAPRGLQPADG